MKKKTPAKGPAPSPAPTPASTGPGFSAVEAAAILELLKSGAVFSAGSRTPLLRVEGDKLIVTTPKPPPVPSEEAATVAYLQQSRELEEMTRGKNLRMAYQKGESVFEL